MEIEIIKKKSEVPMVHELKTGEVFQLGDGITGVKLDGNHAVILLNSKGEDAFWSRTASGHFRPARILGRMVGIKVEPQ